ncbi:hypothetical protein ACO0LO_07430 [Undibacterium sp. TJN25]|uniref:hypothetical protein n=1 Tax=Undibacterium sp. TJN25 TaxID=3413056 RepID=UPI003BF16934
MMKLQLRTSAAVSLSLSLVLLLSACGGSSSSPPPVTPPVTPPVSMVDAFFSIVAKLIGDSPETTEPQSTDTIQATAPENTEPVTPI